MSNLTSLHIQDPFYLSEVEISEYFASLNLDENQNRYRVLSSLLSLSVYLYKKVIFYLVRKSDFSIEMIEGLSEISDTSIEDLLYTYETGINNLANRINQVETFLNNGNNEIEYVKNLFVTNKFFGSVIGDNELKEAVTTLMKFRFIGESFHTTYVQVDNTRVDSSNPKIFPSVQALISKYKDILNHNIVINDAYEDLIESAGYNFFSTRYPTFNDNFLNFKEHFYILVKTDNIHPTILNDNNLLTISAGLHRFRSVRVWNDVYTKMVTFTAKNIYNAERTGQFSSIGESLIDTISEHISSTLLEFDSIPQDETFFPKYYEHVLYKYYFLKFSALQSFLDSDKRELLADTVETIERIEEYLSYSTYFLQTTISQLDKYLVYNTSTN